MLRNFAQLSLRSIYGTRLLRVDGLSSTTKCGYARWASRRPVAILNEDEVFGDDDTQTNITKPPKKRAKARKEKLKAEKKPEEKEEEKPVKRQPLYTALKENDKLIRYIVH